MRFKNETFNFVLIQELLFTIYILYTSIPYFLKTIFLGVYFSYIVLTLKFHNTPITTIS